MVVDKRRYGFPATADGVVKLANHGEGVPLDPDAPREVTAPMLLAARRFLRDRLPALAEAPIVATRLCLYCDTFDGDFLIDRSPDVAGLVVATGGSGHGFKFAPVLGRLVGEALDGAAHPRFAWRARQAAAKESARARGRGLGVRWEETWAGLGLTPPRAALAALLDAWSQPARAYHGLQHLDTCLRAAEAVSDLASRPAEVALALWLHDAVYDPRARPGDNEAKSALWAAELLREAGAEAEVVARVSAMIEATAHHDREDPGDDEGGDGALLLDIDLAVLGAGPAAYAAYEAGVRAEYAFAPDAAWRVGRRAVLEGILGRPWIYRTAVFRELFETRARENLSAALASLA